MTAINTGMTCPENRNAGNGFNACQLARVLEYYRHNTGASLDCAFATGILRNCITWYISDLVERGLLKSISVHRDRRTGCKANHYTADRSKWPVVKENAQYELILGRNNYGRCKKRMLRVL